ncbi:uracil-xanthine permease family protein [Laribacter hongkongensis]|uniref:uracil-xanthine permease family protein n=1 Tax=Laribacter hongkongensis TaxID=168471 RepID=UPI001878CA38|nr:uracil-xanthine permease family protein [Laribacter hongkongensis]MBE5527353.1 uracil permease [Laribacter hongkongensis]MCG9030555.1 uracil-xanthine permease family protein [Laribacter hongkongensis]MCG9040892.1 uracil-xanthine permease family protein [Laribacter hongkongensis]MCG9056407.1 uracil-xanthine permease family protein [Laribacter hongkongensis]MCG9058404.1 uracil-xanthine permease family protein [Laribacter hongkongensis]
MLNHLKQAVAGAQILFVAFGALVLVPLLTGLNPAMALLGAGIGTLLFQLCTGRKVPIFLGSSFAFIAPIIYATQTWGLPSTMFGLFAAGFMYFVFAALVRWRGMDAVNKLLPPVVIGPVIMIIGLSVATVASSMAMGRAGGEQVIPYTDALLLAAVSLATTVMVSIFARGMFRLVPILAGVIVGYVVAAFMGLVDFGKIANAPWFAVPHFVTPEVNWAAALFMLPVAIAPAIEHIGGVMAISGVTGKDYTKTPGLHRTLAGDGLGVCVAGLIGGPPVTTYAEVTGAVMITRNFNPVVMTWAAVFAICMAFFGKFNALLQSIPMPVMGGIMVLLFGTIASIGLKTLIEAKTDLMAPKNLVIVSVVLTAGIGALELKLGSFTLVGVGLCSILAIVLNWILPQGKNHDGIAEGQDV